MKIIRRSPKKIKIPLFDATVQAGFPSPASDLIERKLDLHTFLVSKPASTFFVRVAGESMIGAHIQPGDILVIDRSLEPIPNQIVMAVVDGEFTLKRFTKRSDGFYLEPENPSFKSIKFREEDDISIWGVVTGVVRKLI